MYFSISPSSLLHNKHGYKSKKLKLNQRHNPLNVHFVTNSPDDLQNTTKMTLRPFIFSLFCGRFGQIMLNNRLH